QPMPNPLSWYFHHLPKRLHRAEVLGNHFAQLVVPWFLFFPQPIATLAGIVITVTQAWLLLSGNFSWLNVITIALAISAFDDVAGVRVQRKAWRRPPPPAPVRAVSPAARLADVVRGHELADVPRVVHAAARKAARSGPRCPSPAARGPLRRKAAAIRPRAALPLSLHNFRGAARDRGVVAPRPRRRVRAARRAATRVASERYGAFNSIAPT